MHVCECPQADSIPTLHTYGSKEVNSAEISEHVKPKVFAKFSVPGEGSLTHIHTGSPTGM